MIYCYRKRRAWGQNTSDRVFIPLLIALSLLFAGCQTADSKDAYTNEQSMDNHLSEGNMETIYLAGGCFWGVQKFIDQFDGVVNTQTDQ